MEDNTQYRKLWYQFKHELDYIRRETPDKLFAKHLGEVLLLAEGYQAMIVEKDDVSNNTQTST